tara:strand:- start:3288 stop:3701 length:414 start_codon:yes stop_codon:yes gene_type:complete
MMTVETYTYSPEEEDQRVYQMLREWSPKTFPPGNYLPKLGVIVYDELGTAQCYVSADMSNSIPRAYLDYLQTNPSATKFSRWKAVKLAEKFLCMELKRLGYHVVMAMTELPGVAFLSQKLGYWVNPIGLTYICKEIK